MTKPTCESLVNAQRMLTLLSNKWSIHIVSVIWQDTKRFSEIQKAMPDTTQKVLTETLRKLERNGILERRLYPTIPPQAEYKLTSLGLELLEYLKSMAGWAEKHEEKIKRAQKTYDKRIRQQQLRSGAGTLK